MPQMGGIADPTLSTPGSGSSPRAYRDEADEDDNPYAPGPRHRMSRQLSEYGRPPGKVDKCPSWKGHSMERLQEYRTTLQA